MSIGDLIEAAAFLERVEQFREHATILNNNHSAKTYFNDEDDSPPPHKRRRTKSFYDSCVDDGHNSNKQNVNFQVAVRPSHNELEKNRRANMRIYLEKLKGIVPLSPDANRHTTLTLLTKAVNYIQTLEEEEIKLQNEKNILLAHEMYLHRRMQLLTGRITTGYCHKTSTPTDTQRLINNNVSPISCESPSSSSSLKLDQRSKFKPQSPLNAKNTSESCFPITLINPQNAQNWPSKHLSFPPAIIDYEPFSKLEKQFDNLTYLDNYHNNLNSFYSYFNYFKSQPSNVAACDNISLVKKSTNDDCTNKPYTLINDDNEKDSFPWLKHFQATVPYFNQFIYQSLMNKHFAPIETLDPSNM